MKEPHPLTKLIPIRADRDELAFNIAQNGQQRPVLIYEKKILEGRVRYLACGDVGVQPRLKDWVLWVKDDKIDPLEWIVRHHVESHQPDEQELVKLVASVLPYFKGRPGNTAIVLNKATGLSHHKVRYVWALLDAGKLDPVLAGEQKLLDAALAIGVKSSSKGMALGKSYGAGDKFNEAVWPLKRYLAAWKRKGYEFRHVNPKEAKRRLSLIESLLEELEAVRPDLQKRSKEATLSAPPERKR